MEFLYSAAEKVRLIIPVQTMEFLYSTAEKVRLITIISQPGAPPCFSATVARSVSYPQMALDVSFRAVCFSARILA